VEFVSRHSILSSLSITHSLAHSVIQNLRIEGIVVLFFDKTGLGFIDGSTARLLPFSRMFCEVVLSLKCCPVLHLS